MAERTVWDMQDDFHNAVDDEGREAIKNEMRAAGYNGVADTIGQDRTLRKNGFAWSGPGRQADISGYDLDAELDPPGCSGRQTRTESPLAWMDWKLTTGKPQAGQLIDSPTRSRAMRA
jgi:hypothetical protein